MIEDKEGLVFAHALRRDALAAVTSVLVVAGAARASGAEVTSAEAGGARPANTAPELTAEAIQSQLAQVKATTDIDDATKTVVVDFYQKALAELERAATWSKQAAAFKTAAEQAPAQLETVRRALDAPADSARPQVKPQASLAECETALAHAQTELNQAQDEIGRAHV